MLLYFQLIQMVFVNEPCSKTTMKTADYYPDRLGQVPGRTNSGWNRTTEEEITQVFTPRGGLMMTLPPMPRVEVHGRLSDNDFSKLLVRFYAQGGEILTIKLEYISREWMRKAGIREPLPLFHAPLEYNNPVHFTQYRRPKEFHLQITVMEDNVVVSYREKGNWSAQSRIVAHRCPCCALDYDQMAFNGDATVYGVRVYPFDKNYIPRLIR